MRRFILLSIIVAALLVSLNSCSEEPLTKENLLTTLDSLEHKLTWLDYRIESEQWHQHKYGYSDSLEFCQELYSDILRDGVAFHYLQNGANLLDNEVDQRRRDILFGEFLTGKIEFEVEIASLRKSLAKAAGRFSSNFDGSPRTQEFLYDAYRTDPDRVRRESAYRAWCAVGEEIGDDLEKLFRLRNQKTQRLGYNNFLALQFNASNVSLDAHMKLLRHLDSLSEAPYRAILDEIRNDINLPDLEIWDLGFAFAGIHRRVDGYFPGDAQLQFVSASLEDIGFDLDKLPIYVDEETPDLGRQPLRAYSIKPPHDLRVLGRVNGGFDGTLALLNQIGKAVHFSHVTQDEPLFITDVDDICVEAIGDVFENLPKDAQWLTTYAGMPAGLAEEFARSLKKEGVISLRASLLNAEFEVQAYLNPNRNITKLYWDLFEKYMLLPRHEDLKPWATVTCYAARPAATQYALYADLVAAQTLDFMRQNYGGVVANEMTSSFLTQNYFRFGGRYDWRELVKRGTDEELNPRYLAVRLGI